MGFEMKRIRGRVFFVLLLILGLSLFADKNYIIDGIVSESEYETVESKGKMQINIDIDGEFIRFLVSSETEGWVSLGFNSKKMNNSDIFMAYVKNDKEYVSEQKGVGHSLKDRKNSIITEYKVIEIDGITSFEGKIKKSDLIKPDQIKLDVILAYGKKDSFKTMHEYRSSIVVNLE